jgi:hypothetical protein
MSAIQSARRGPSSTELRALSDAYAAKQAHPPGDARATPPIRRRVDSVDPWAIIAPVQNRTPVDKGLFNPALAEVPREAWPACVRDPQPYRPLPAAGTPDGRFLFPAVVNYEPDTVFASRMVAAQARVMEQLSEMAATGRATLGDIERLILQLGKERAAIAAATPVDSAARGADLTTSLHGKPMGASRSADYVSPHPDSRHVAYHPRALAWVKVSESAKVLTHEQLGAPSIDVVVQGRLVPARLCEAAFGRARLGVTTDQDIVITHPSASESRYNRMRAYALIGEVVIRADLTEQQAMRDLGEAHCLLMHGTPLIRGTPSCLETLIDGVLRVRHGVCLPAKRPGIEPFWEAVFTPGSQMSVYADNFRHFFA